MKALFVREDSIYKELIGADNCYDKARNALTYSGNDVLIAHPPCRCWGNLWHYAQPSEIQEPYFAIWSVEKIIANGGVLEHPSKSFIFKAYHHIMQQSGFVQELDQFRFGHKAEKPTKLFICGITPEQLPAIPVRVGKPQYGLSTSSKKSSLKCLPPNERDITPVGMAKFLIEIAKRIENNK